MNPKDKEVLTKFIKELLQEVGRMYAIASPVISLYFIGLFETLKDTGEFPINWKYLLAISAIAIIKGTDRALHESGISKKGIVRF